MPEQEINYKQLEWFLFAGKHVAVEKFNLWEMAV